MPKGKANIKFTGGCLAGEHFEDIDTRTLLDEISEPTGVWIRDDDDKVQIMKGGDLDKNWMSYQIHIYTKASKDKSGYYEYKYDRDGVIERCSAITKKGVQCSKTCYKDLNVCETHKTK